MSTYFEPDSSHVLDGECLTVTTFRKADNRKRYMSALHPRYYPTVYALSLFLLYRKYMYNLKIILHVLL